VTPATTIEVLADPSRRQILDALRDGEQSVNALVTRLDLSQPSVSKHLKVLRDAGLVDVRPDGQRRLYRLRAEPLMELDAWLEPYRRLWRTSLDKLERHLTDSGADSYPESDSHETDPSTNRRNAS
jgi:DNA-binding transcriptional ArsR family regulator